MNYFRLLLVLCMPMICFTNSYAETQKKEIQNSQVLRVLDEATKVAMVTWPSVVAKQKSKVLSQIAIRWARVKNHEKANLLFTKATELIKPVKRKSANFESILFPVQQFKEIAQAQYEIGYLSARDKTFEKISNLIRKISFSYVAAIPLSKIEKGMLHNFLLDLLLGKLYADVGKTEEAHKAVSRLEENHHKLTKDYRYSNYHKRLKDLAVLQIRMGNVTEGLNALESAEKFVAEKWRDRDEEIAVTQDKNGVTYPLTDQTRNRMVLEVARAIGKSGDRMILRNLLKHSFDLSTGQTIHPNLRVHMLSGLINLAAEFDEIDLAMQAFLAFPKLSPDPLYVKSIDPQLILACARKKDAKKVEELLTSYSISRYDHALVLIELGKLEDAFQVIENPERPFRSATPPATVSWQQYTQIMGRARFEKQGFNKAFSWAKNRVTPDDKANALLGIADVLLQGSALN